MVCLSFPRPPLNCPKPLRMPKISSETNPSPAGFSACSAISVSRVRLLAIQSLREGLPGFEASSVCSQSSTSCCQRACQERCCCASRAPPALADQVRGVVEHAMIEGMQTFVSAVPITAEAVVGSSWAEK